MRLAALLGHDHRHDLAAPGDQIAQLTRRLVRQRARLGPRSRCVNAVAVPRGDAWHRRVEGWGSSIAGAFTPDLASYVVAEKPAQANRLKKLSRAQDRPGRPGIAERVRRGRAS
jgi:hypothetical protein